MTWHRKVWPVPFAPVTGIVVVRSGSSFRPVGRRWLFGALVAVALGVLVGAMACVEGLSGGHDRTSSSGESPVTVAALDQGQHAGSHPGHGGDHDPAPIDRSHAGEAHPGLACAVLVEFRVPAATVTPVDDRCLPELGRLVASWSADLDPPVPRAA